jgi:hypothetical protein
MKVFDGEFDDTTRGSATKQRPWVEVVNSRGSPASRVRRWPVLRGPE